MPRGIPGSGKKPKEFELESPLKAMYHVQKRDQRGDTTPLRKQMRQLFETNLKVFLELMRKYEAERDAEQDAMNERIRKRAEAMEAAGKKPVETPVSDEGTVRVQTLLAELLRDVRRRGGLPPGW